jgi:hypothetical protein
MNVALEYVTYINILSMSNTNTLLFLPVNMINPFVILLYLPNFGIYGVFNVDSCHSSGNITTFFNVFLFVNI